MKVLIKYTLGLTLLLVVFVSCDKDDSTSYTREINEYFSSDERAVEEKTLGAFVNEQFTFDPQLSWKNEKGDTIRITDSQINKYNFEWRLYLTPGLYVDTISKVISTDYICDYIVTDINPASDSYYLSFLATNSETDEYHKLWFELKVLSTYGNGFLIANSYDGVNTDLSLLMSINCTPDYEEDWEPKLRHKLLEENNGTPLPGIVSDIASIASGSSFFAQLCVPGESITEVNLFNMKYERKNQELFAISPEVWNPQGVGSNGYGFMSVVNNNKYTYFDTRDGFTYDFGDDSPYDFETFGQTDYDGGYTVSGGFQGIDKNTNKLVSVDNYGRFKRLKVDNDNGAFSINDWSNWNIITIGRGPDYEYHYFVVEDKSTSERFILEMKSDWGGNYTASRKIDLSAFPGTSEVNHFEFSRNAEECFYGYENKLYCILLKDNAVNLVESYVFPDNESVTFLAKQRSSDGMVYWDDATDPDTGKDGPNWRWGREIIVNVATYDNATKKGYLYMLPIEFSGRGGIAAEEYTKKYDGFGKINFISHI